jgi:pterin-4a-carbinolamine dehydratase
VCLATGWHPLPDSSLTHSLVALLRRRCTGHSARTQVAVDNTVTVELSTLPIGGLSDNDFIIAAKVDALSLTDLLVAAKKRTYYF